MAEQTFTAQIKDFLELSKKNMKYVAVNAIQDVMEGAQTPQLAISKGATSFVEGKIPVAESGLINSLTSEGVGGSTSYMVALAGFKLGDYMHFEWTAEYALRIEAGYSGMDALGRVYNQPGRHFVSANAAIFSLFVNKRVAEVKG